MLRDITTLYKKLASELSKSKSREGQKKTLSDLTSRQDPYSANFISKNQLSTPYEIHFGRIIDCIPSLNIYKVQIDRSNNTILCTDLTNSSFSPFGAKRLSSLSVGNGVFVIVGTKSEYGFIIGTAPDQTLLSKFSISDFVVQGGRVGVKTDLSQHIGSINQDIIRIADFGGGRPVDSLNVGEWGAITETGLGIFLDPFLAYMRVNEATGLFLFYNDALARLSGYNLEINSSVSNRQDYNDQFELFQRESFSSYPWEALGAYYHNINNFVNVGFDAVKYFQNVSSTELVDPYLEPIHRLDTFKGYLGQVESKFVSIPNYFIYGGVGVNTMYAAPSPRKIGVYEEHTSMAGRHVMRSAKGITIGKTTRINIPFQLIKPESNMGDTINNYRFSSIKGNGLLHNISAELYVNPADPNIYASPNIQSTLILDHLAYQYNWEVLHPFLYHCYDWFVPPEYQNRLYTSQTFIPDYNYLQNSQFLPIPVYFTLQVDHRHVSTYYNCESFLTFMEEGSIVLADGYGFELRTSQGNAYFSVPGDIYFISGKNIVAFSGQSTYLNAFHDVEISAAKNSVRVYADRNIMVSSGNSGCGGVLIESRGNSIASGNFDTAVGRDVQFNGIILVSRKSHISALSSHMLFSTNLQRYSLGKDMMDSTAGIPADSDKGEQEAAGPIVLDAGTTNKSNIICYSNIFLRKVKKGTLDAVYIQNPNSCDEDDPDEKEDNCSDTNDLRRYSFTYLTHKLFHVGARTEIRGRLNVAGCVTASRDIQTVKDFKSPSGYVKKEFVSDISTSIISNNQTIKSFLFNNRNGVLGRELLINGKLMMAEFSFKTVTQYETNAYRLFEPLWIKYSRLRATNLPGWYFNPVYHFNGGNKPANSTAAFPGRDHWVGWINSFVITNPKYYNPVNNSYADYNVCASGYVPYMNTLLNLSINQPITNLKRIPSLFET